MYKNSGWFVNTGANKMPWALVILLMWLVTVLHYDERYYRGF